MKKGDYYTIRTEEKKRQIEGFLEELKEIIPENFQEYNNNKTKAACERYFERIIESASDLALLLITDHGFEKPEEEKRIFHILAEEKIIQTDLADRLREAKGMRNILAHQYSNIDDGLVFKAITEELIIDVKEFLRQV